MLDAFKVFVALDPMRDAFNVFVALDGGPLHGLPPLLHRLDVEHLLLGLGLGLLIGLLGILLNGLDRWLL